MDVAFLCHPYHRGGVTKWMANAFNSWNANLGLAYFVTVTPDRPFISASDRPLVVSMVDAQYIKNMFDARVNYSFELGNTPFRASIYRKIILANIPEGVPIIPSDDEACWLAASTLATRNPFIPIIHSFGDDTYYLLLKRFSQSALGIVAVSKRVKIRVLEVLHEFPNERLLVNPCGLPVNKIEAHKRKNNVVWVGRMEEKSKRVSDLPKIIAGADRFNVSVNFVIIGSGEMLPMMEQFAGTFTSKRVTIDLRGWLEHEDINELLATSKVLILTSNYEGMPISVMEALANGCSVVSTWVSGVEDIEETPGISNILYRYKVGDISQAIMLIEKAIINHDSRVEQMANELAFEYFSIDKRNESMSLFLESLLDGGAIVKESALSWWKVKISNIIAFLRLVKWQVKQ